MCVIFLNYQKGSLTQVLACVSVWWLSVLWKRPFSRFSLAAGWGAWHAGVLLFNLSSSTSKNLKCTNLHDVLKGNQMTVLMCQHIMSKMFPCQKLRVLQRKLEEHEEALLGRAQVVDLLQQELTAAEQRNQVLPSDLNCLPRHYSFLLQFARQQV